MFFWCECLLTSSLCFLSCGLYVEDSSQNQREGNSSMFLRWACSRWGLSWQPVKCENVLLFSSLLKVNLLLFSSEALYDTRLSQRSGDLSWHTWRPKEEWNIWSGEFHNEIDIKICCYKGIVRSKITILLFFNPKTFVHQSVNEDIIIKLKGFRFLHWKSITQKLHLMLQKVHKEITKK